MYTHHLFVCLWHGRYMAPEMVILLCRSPAKVSTKQFQSENKYDYAVDWWSFGATAWKLLTGKRPFSKDRITSLIDLSAYPLIYEVIKENKSNRDYVSLFQKLDFPRYLSPEAKDLLQGLLTVIPGKRLGCDESQGGIEAIKRHAFFKGIDWERLELKQVHPPFKPDILEVDFDVESPAFRRFHGDHKYPDLRSLLEKYDKESLMLEEVEEADQQYFAKWDFISTHTMRVEAGLSQMMDQLVSNSKVKKLVGDG